jgi:hypothetical protein
MNAIKDFPCIHRGTEPVETRLCDLCGVKGQPFEVYPCKLFGECSVQRKHSQVRGCAACEARTLEGNENMPATLPEGIQRINANLQRAITSGRFLVAIAFVEDGTLHVERETSDAFPKADYPEVSRLFVESLMAEAEQEFRSAIKQKGELRIRN